MRVKIPDLNTFDWFLLAIGLYLTLFPLVFYKFGVPVEIKVVSQKMNFFGGFTVSPEYEIIAGEFVGLRRTSKIGTSFGTHRTGTVKSGFYLQGLRYIESEISLRVTAIIGICVLIGVIIYNVAPLF